MTDESRHQDGWQPIQVCPWGRVVQVRNYLMRFPVYATRGYSSNGVVNADHTLFTARFTPDPDGLCNVPTGQMICPTEWRNVDEATRHD